MRAVRHSRSPLIIPLVRFFVPRRGKCSDPRGPAKPNPQTTTHCTVPGGFLLRYALRRKCRHRRGERRAPRTGVSRKQEHSGGLMSLVSSTPFPRRRRGLAFLALVPFFLHLLTARDRGDQGRTKGPRNKGETHFRHRNFCEVGRRDEGGG